MIGFDYTKEAKGGLYECMNFHCVDISHDLREPRSIGEGRRSAFLSVFVLFFLVKLCLSRSLKVRQPDYGLSPALNNLTRPLLQEILI